MGNESHERKQMDESVLKSVQYDEQYFDDSSQNDEKQPLFVVQKGTSIDPDQIARNYQTHVQNHHQMSQTAHLN